MKAPIQIAIQSAVFLIALLALGGVSANGNYGDGSSGASDGASGNDSTVAPSAYNSADESMDKPEVVAAANYCDDVVKETFGEEGLARIDIDEELPDYFYDSCYWCGDSYVAMGIDFYGSVWGWDGITWNWIDDDGVDVAVGWGDAFLTKTDGTIWYWSGFDFVPYWTDGGYLERVEADIDGTLYGIDGNGDVFTWDEIYEEWRFIIGDAVNLYIDVDVESYELYITRTDGQAYGFKEESQSWEVVNWARRSLATRRIEF
ncbi:MAG: hypothetical protein KTR16_12250 [Acidiferrobacterales bacterium]|nr:hypothetical protein [Acidiferrobacterales bacterium]